jgi:hypothetical protein
VQPAGQLYITCNILSNQPQQLRFRNYLLPVEACRGRAYATSDDYMAEDPICLKTLLSKENVYPGAVECFGWCVG